MDLRWIEGEIEELSAIWEELRYKRPRFEHGLIDANDGESLSFSLSSRLSAWKELLSQVEVQLAANAGDDDADDCVEADIDAAEIRIMDEVKTQNATIDSLNNTTTTTAAAASPAKEEEHDSAIDYEFGMCLVGGVTAEKMEHNSNDRGGGGSGGMSVWDRYASKSLEVASTTTTKIDVPIICNKCGQEKNGKKLVEKAEDALPEEVLSSLEVIHARCLALHPKIEKLRKKSKEVGKISCSVPLFILLQYAECHTHFTRSILIERFDNKKTTYWRKDQGEGESRSSFLRGIGVGRVHSVVG